MHTLKEHFSPSVHITRESDRQKDKKNGDFLPSHPAISQVHLEKIRRYVLLLTTGGVTDVLDDSAIIGRAAKLRLFSEVLHLSFLTIAYHIASTLLVSR